LNDDRSPEPLSETVVDCDVNLVNSWICSHTVKV
jgi:hypothetical protein